MSGGVKLTMYLSYYDPKNELVVSPIGISKSCAQLLSSKRKHESNLLPKSPIALPAKTATPYRIDAGKGVRRAG